MTELMNLQQLMDTYSPGDPHSWREEMVFLRTEHAQQIAKLTLDIAKNGIREPIQLGPDGRVWDGHHRITVAHALGDASVPVEKVSAVPAEPVDENATVQALRVASANEMRRVITNIVTAELVDVTNAYARTNHTPHGYSAWVGQRDLLLSILNKIKAL